MHNAVYISAVTLLLDKKKIIKTFNVYNKMKSSRYTVVRWSKGPLYKAL